MSSGLIYFKDGDLIAESGEVKIYKFNNDLFLEIGPGHNLWALGSEISDYIWQLNDRPKGKCLEIGLGLGVASKYILSLPKVKSLTTIELNKDVIDAYKQLKPEHYSLEFEVSSEKRHTVLNADGLIYMYETNQTFDFVFIDCYSIIDEDTLPMIADISIAARRILNNGGEVVGWFDKATPEKFVQMFYSLFDK